MVTFLLYAHIPICHTWKHYWKSFSKSILSTRFALHIMFSYDSEWDCFKEIISSSWDIKSHTWPNQMAVVGASELVLFCQNLFYQKCFVGRHSWCKIYLSIHGLYIWPAYMKVFLLKVKYQHCFCVIACVSCKVFTATVIYNLFEVI
jgi:hypothetical protein